MVRRIGNVITFFIMMLCLHSAIIQAAPQLTLSVTDMQGQPLKSAGVGVPCMIQVTVTDAQGSVQMPKVHGLDRMVQGPIRSSSKVSMINGVTYAERNYFYTIRIDQPGNYVLGPAELEYQGSRLTSEPIKLHVAQQAQHAQATASTSSDKPATLELVVNKDAVTVGQRLILTIRFTHELDVQLAQPLSADFTQAKWLIRSQTEPRSGQKMINGKKYLFSEQQFELYCYEPGQRTIPAITAVCLVPAPSSRSRLDGFFDVGDFFGRRRQEYVAQSNAVIVDVEPLPPYKGTVHAIGDIKTVTASVDHPSAKEGEGIVYKLVVEGSGDGIGLEAPVLVIPSALKYYESKSDLNDNSNYGTQWKKTFEYIVQATKGGTFQIPAQSFTFFDPDEAKYKTLKTNPITLAIESGSPKGIVQVQSTEVQLDSQVQEREPLQPLYQGSQWHETTPRSIPLFFFLLISMLLVGALIIIPIVRSWYAQRALAMPHTRRKNAFKKARKSFEKYKKSGEVAKLYGVVIALFAERFNVSASAVSEQFMETVLTEAGMTRDKINAWLKDWAQVAEQVYFNPPLSPEQTIRVFDFMDRWLLAFEDVL